MESLYRFLSGVADALGIDARLTLGGESRDVRVSFEGNVSEPIGGGRYDAVREKATFGVDLEALSDAAGNVRFPQDGDRLEFERDGRRYCYRVAASSETSRRWDWRFKRPGTRIVFYATRDAPKEDRLARNPN